MRKAPRFELYEWTADHARESSLVLTGSAAQALSVRDLEDLSVDRQRTAAALQIGSLKLGLGRVRGDQELRREISNLYNGSITSEHVLVVNGTTGANHLCFEALLGPGDHVICLYPCYGPLIDIPKALGVDLSFWSLDFEKCWEPNLSQLRSLVRYNTKMIIINNPHNPTGFVFSDHLQQQIVDLAYEHHIILFSDEIFRPLFHTNQPEALDRIPKSFVEHSQHRNIIVTGSMSKAYGLSGVRVGWIICRDPAVLRNLLHVRGYVLNSVSVVDEMIAREALSVRCRSGILRSNLEFASLNLTKLGEVISRHKNAISWVKSAGAGTSFVRFCSARTGQPLDDVQLCRALLAEKDVLFAPGSLCFGVDEAVPLRGFVRVHITAPPALFQRACDLLDDFVGSETYAKLS